jgi:hypothetical protein
MYSRRNRESSGKIICCRHFSVNCLPFVFKLGNWTNCAACRVIFKGFNQLVQAGGMKMQAKKSSAIEKRASDGLKPSALA